MGSGSKKQKDNVSRVEQAVATPQTIEEAAALLGKFGELYRETKRISAEADTTISQIRQTADHRINLIKVRMSALYLALRAFAEVKRDELTQQGKTKTINLATGTLSWRDTPPKVVIADMAVALAEILEKKLDAFIRRPEPQINKEALLADRDAASQITGVTFTQGEEFKLKPEDRSQVLAENGPPQVPATA